MNMPRDDLPGCDCRSLERATHDPDNPIEKEEPENMFGILWQTQIRSASV